MDCFSAFLPALKDVVVLVAKVLWTFCLLLARCCPGSVPECIWTKPFVSNNCSYLRIGWTFVGAWASSFMGSISGDGFENGWRSRWSRMWNKGWTLVGHCLKQYPVKLQSYWYRFTWKSLQSSLQFRKGFWIRPVMTHKWIHISYIRLYRLIQIDSDCIVYRL